MGNQDAAWEEAASLEEPAVLEAAVLDDGAPPQAARANIIAADSSRDAILFLFTEIDLLLSMLKTCGFRSAY